jgi:gentisate 1,2-dioxygenase
MMKRSSIVTPESVLHDFYEDLRRHDLAPAWASESGAGPRHTTLPYVWHWRDIRPRALRAAELVGTEQAERRVLRLCNPGLEAGGASARLVANVQIVMPGEIARAHRHTPAALRLIIEAAGGYTVVNGEQIPMQPGDLVLTPNWTWHDHANDSGQPVIWLDGLDVPLVRMLDAYFYEQYPQETQPVGEAVDRSLDAYGAGGLRPAWEGRPRTAYSPLMHYPYAQVRPALERLMATTAGSPFDGVIMEYTNPVTGGPVMPTIGCYVQMLRPGERTQAHRHTGTTLYHVIEGEGTTIVDGKRLEWTDKDVVCVPSWAFHEHLNLSPGRPAVLFSFTDEPVMRALDLYREEARGDG